MEQAPENRIRPTVVMVHAHPDDEAIFTGGTLALLHRSGCRTVVVVATSGQLGQPVDPTDGSGGPPLGDRRRAETERSCAILGVDRLIVLDHADSGLGATRPDGAYADLHTEVAAAEIAAILVEEGADAIVAYDEHGIYGHPDHVKVHDASIRAADLAGVDTRYLATVDREYLHFVATHIVQGAGASLPSMRPIGSATVEIDTVVEIASVLALKRAAIAAHESQIGDDPWLGVPDDFADVYGYEWYVRVGPAGPLDHLGALAGDSGSRW